jgi:hypothetical protein
VTTTRRSSNSTSSSSSRGVKKTDAAPTTQDIAAEAAAIYPDTFETPPTPEQIAAEAYDIYIARGGEHGRDADDWYEAERRLTERRRNQPANQSRAREVEPL